MLRTIFGGLVLAACVGLSFLPFFLSKAWLVGEWTAEITSELAAQQVQCTNRVNDLINADSTSITKPNCQPGDTTPASSPNDNVADRVRLINEAQGAMNSLAIERNLLSPRIDQYLLAAKLAAFGAWGGLGHAVMVAIGIYGHLRRKIRLDDPDSFAYAAGSMFVGGILGVAVSLLIGGDATDISGRLIAISLASGLIGDAALNVLRAWFNGRQQQS